LGFIATEGEAQTGAVSRGWMVRSITIFSVLMCVLCVYVSVAYVLWKQFHVMEQMNSIQRHFTGPRLQLSVRSYSTCRRRCNTR